jgi:hypothetical protein
MNIRLIDGRRIEFFQEDGLAGAVGALYADSGLIHASSGFAVGGGLSMSGDLNLGDANRKFIIGAGETDVTLRIENSGAGKAHLSVEGSITAVNFVGTVEGIDVSDLAGTVNLHIANSSLHLSEDEKNALKGTNGTPGDTNRFVTNSDSRMTDARTPLAHGDDKHTALSYFKNVTDGTNTFNATSGHQNIKFAAVNGTVAITSDENNDAIVTFTSHKISISRATETLSAGVAQDGTLTVPSYTVGANNLMVFMENMILIKDVDYTEVSATTIKTLADIPTGAVLTYLVFNL